MPLHEQNLEMENRRTKLNNFIMGSKSDMGCKKHLRHKQSPGVCSVCLGERLSKLSSSSSSKTTNKVVSVSSCSSSSSLSSCYSSIEGSPVHHKYRLGSMKNVKMTGALKSEREDVFKKSKSVAAVERLRKIEGEEGKNKKKKNGFLSKLLRLKRKKIEVGLVSSSMATTRVH